jgi:hypothetical protein
MNHPCAHPDLAVVDGARRPHRAAWWTCLAVSGATALLAAASDATESISTARLEVTRDGKAMLVLDADEHGGIMRVLNADGWEVLTLRADPEGDGLLVLRNERGKQSAALQSSERGGQVMLFRGTDEAGVSINADGLTRLVPVPPDGGPQRRPSVDEVAAINQALASLEKRHDSLEQVVGDLARIAPTSATSDTRRTIEDLNRRLREQEDDLDRFRSLVQDQDRDMDDLRREIADLERQIRQRPSPLE